jgi:hypothetical protein
MRRGRVLMAQFPASPLGPPPDRLTAEELRAWRDVSAAAPDLFRRRDRKFVELLAVCLAQWRSGYRDFGFLRVLYRMLGHCFIPMRERRRLLFPENQC